MSDPLRSSDIPSIRGIEVTPTMQCAHWKSPLDVIAIKHFCCQKFYACISCHDALEDHKSGVWPKSEWNEVAVLCGKCKRELTVQEYLKSGSRCSGQKGCGSAFNPGCQKHWDMYFDVEKV
jgi:uncharacterized CHY-type Zn-finger protein